MPVSGKATVSDENRFDNDASRYAAYLNTPEGRLRTDLTFCEFAGALACAGSNEDNMRSRPRLRNWSRFGSAGARRNRCDVARFISGDVGFRGAAHISRSAEYQRIFALERDLGMRPEFFGVARYIHYLVSPILDVSKGE